MTKFLVDEKKIASLFPESKRALGKTVFGHRLSYDLNSFDRPVCSIRPRQGTPKRATITVGEKKS